MKPIIQATRLSRFYGIILGLNNVSFEVLPGITGIVGPNGAGKTTLFRLMVGQIKPCSGELRVLGESPWNNPKVHAQLGYCPEGEAVPASLRPFEWLTALGMISGMSGRDARERADAALRRVQLGPEHWRKQLTQLSKGMRQRVKLAQCLLHDPALVILDEPMNGLDPMGREAFANVLRELAGRGVSVVISSHILPDLESLCSRFILLRWGRIPNSRNQPPSAEKGAADPMPEGRVWPEATTVRCADPEQLARFLMERHLLQGCDIATDSGILLVRWRDPEAFFQRFPELLIESGVTIFEVRATTSLLEQVVASPMTR